MATNLEFLRPNLTKLRYLERENSAKKGRFPRSKGAWPQKISEPYPLFKFVDPRAQKKESSSKTGIIVGSVLGCIAFFGVVFAIFAFMLHGQRRHEAEGKFIISLHLHFIFVIYIYN